MATGLMVTMAEPVFQTKAVDHVPYGEEQARSHAHIESDMFVTCAVLCCTLSACLGLNSANSLLVLVEAGSDESHAFSLFCFCPEVSTAPVPLVWPGPRRQETET